MENLKTYLPFLPWSWVSWMQRTEAAGSSASTGAGLHETSGQASAQRHVEASGCPFAYLHQGDAWWHRGWRPFWRGTAEGLRTLGGTEGGLLEARGDF